MQNQSDIQRSLQSVAAALNDGGLESFDTARVQQLVNEAIAGKPSLTVDDGGGLHDPSGARVGAIRRAPSGEWIIDGQNPLAAQSDAEIPAAVREDSEPGEDDNQQR
jgi:hypothetical protein